MFAAFDAKRSHHPCYAATTHDHEGAAVFPADVKVRRIGTVWYGRDSGLLTRQRHRA
jgi:hypothetical protein